MPHDAALRGFQGLSKLSGSFALKGLASGSVGQQASSPAILQDTALKALKSVAKLSGSFALTGLASSAVGARSQHAFAYIDPYLVQPLEPVYPIKRLNGKIVQGLYVTYPAKEILKNPWRAFLPTEILLAVAKSGAIQVVTYLKYWLDRLNEAEEQARERALLEQLPEEDMEVDLPEVPRAHIRQLLINSVWGGFRETCCTFIRTNLEHAAHRSLNPRITWKLLKGFGSSAQRKLKRHGRWYAALHTVPTAIRSSVLAQIADFIFSTAVDAFWLIILPYGLMPLRVYAWQKSDDAQEVQEPADVQLAEEQEQQQLAQQRPRRFVMLGKKTIGNMMRSTVSLSVSAVGAGIFAATGLPGIALAANGADMAVSILLIWPELDEWYERRRFPWTTAALTCTSAGVAIFFLKRGSAIDTKLKIT